jgi:hypothetical protein
MDTIPYFEAGHLARPSLDTSPGTAPARVIDRALLRLWDYRRLLRSPLVQPFRQVLRPFIRWVFKTHLFLAAGEVGGSPVGMNIKPASAAMFALAMVLGPLVVIMLLPLILILLPVAIVIGGIGVAIAAMQTEGRDSDYTLMSWRMA